MIDYKRVGESSIAVTHAGKTLAFQLHELPEDWQSLFRDPEVEECVNEVVIQKGRALRETQGGSEPGAAWDDVQACLDELRGSTG